MNYSDALKTLTENNQEHVFQFWDTLPETQQTELLAQITDLDFKAIAQMREMLENKETSAPIAVEMVPTPVAELEGDARVSAQQIGEAEIQAGRVAALLVAGGQGSRLGYEGPKGAYPVGPLSNEPLFFYHARKILALSKAWNNTIPFYIMTSQANDAQTRACFEENNYFGLNKDDVFFFVQSMWPALTPEGKIILDSPSHIFMGPDGHGGTLSALERSGGLADMVKRGITSIFYFQVDNPLVEVADPAFIGFHKQNNAEVSIKLCAKRDPNEGLGVAVDRNGKTEIVEYTEFTPEQKNERLANGELKYKYGSVAIHIFSTDFLLKEAQAGLPLHIAHKKVPYVNETGDTIKPEAPNAFKFEKFIFDALADANVCACMAFDRTQEFAPVKNADGEDSPATCKAALSAKWAKWLAQAGVTVECDAAGVPVHAIEIDPAFAYSAEALAKRISTDGLAIATDAPIYLK